MDGLDMASAMETIMLLNSVELKEVTDYAQYKLSLRPNETCDIGECKNLAESDCA